MTEIVVCINVNDMTTYNFSYYLDKLAMLHCTRRFDKHPRITGIA